MRRSVLAAVVVTMALAVVDVRQRAAASAPEMKPYPGSTELCSGHVTGAPQRDGKPGSHINWTAYHTVDPQQKVAAHYLKALGDRNHVREKYGDRWRFPADEPTRVLDVTGPDVTLPSATCRKPPADARTVIIISAMSRP